MNLLSLVVVVLRLAEEVLRVYCLHWTIIVMLRIMLNCTDSSCDQERNQNLFYVHQAGNLMYVSKLCHHEFKSSSEKNS